jgi:hypothetical protein
MNGTATATGFKPVLVAKEAEETRPLRWYERFLHNIGVLTMANAPTRPPGFYVNISTVTFFIAVLGTIGGLWWFTWQTAQDVGYQRGKAEAERLVLLERLAKSEADAAEAKKYQVYQSGVADTHNPQKKKEEKK